MQLHQYHRFELATVVATIIIYFSYAAPSIVSADEVVFFSLLDYNPMANFLFQQVCWGGGGSSVCTHAHTVATSCQSHPKQIPIIYRHTFSLAIRRQWNDLFLSL